MNKFNQYIKHLTCDWELVLFLTGVLPGSMRCLSSKEWVYIAWMWLAMTIYQKSINDNYYSYPFIAPLLIL